MRRLKAGDVFEVDVGEGLGTVQGVIARKDGPLLLAYVFPAEAKDVRPDQAIYVGLVGSQGFTDGTWHLRGPLPGFTREGWPVPRFGRYIDGLNGEKYPRMVIRDEALDAVEEMPASPEEVDRLPPDRISGAGAAVYHFRQALRQHRQAKSHRPAA